MKRYKPLHHKPPSGRGYEGADPWGFTPANSPYEQSYITLDDFPGRRFWTWGMFALLENVGEEIVTELREDGWEPRESATNDAFFLLENQFAQTLIVVEHAGPTLYWARTEDIRHAQVYPVFLTYQTGEEEYPHFLPPDMVMGACALIHDGSSWHLYTIDQVGETGQSLYDDIREGMMLFPPGADLWAEQTRRREQQRIVRWEATHAAAQQLAVLYWKLHMEHYTAKVSPRLGLPPLTSAHRTRIPAVAPFQSLTQSFGPAIQRSVWSREQTGTLELVTPDGSLLQVRGTNASESMALHHYVTALLGPEGLKHLLILLDAYYVQTNGEDRKADARVSLRQLLLRLGKGSKADEREEQGKLMHTILYLASTYITSRDQAGVQKTLPKEKTRPLPLARQRKRRAPAQKDYSPLLVIERLKPGLDGTIVIPDEVEYHLGHEFFEALFGTQQQFFAVPTAQLLRYHAVRQQQELLLAFYLSNMLMTMEGPFSVPFPALLLQSALQTQEGLERGHDRLRDVWRTLLAIEQLERDELVVRAAHSTVDEALVAELVLAEQRKARKRAKQAQTREQDAHDLTEDDLAPATYSRIADHVVPLQQLADTEVKRMRRTALQHLLDERFHARIEFAPGRFLQEQIHQRAARQQAAQEDHPSRRKGRALIVDAGGYSMERERGEEEV